MSHDHHGGHNPEPESFVALRTRAIESLLVEKGLLSSDLVDQLVSTYEKDIGPLNGARVVARAWVDPDYRARLLADGSAAISEMGFDGDQNPIQVVENTPGVHNIVVCTLCSCYPWAVLGLPPVWYKSAPYRSRVVIEPRKVLGEFGLQLDDATDVRVWDSSAEQRYMVLPERPSGTDGMSEEDLAAIVTRDAMIGVAKVRVPAKAG